MKRILVWLVVGIGAVSGVTVAARMQAPAPAAPTAAQAPAGEGRGGGGGGRGGGGAPEPTTNERTNVQIDQFIGDSAKSTGHLSHGGLLTRAMLKSGNPNVPGPAGEVLEYRTQAAKATLLPHSSTPLSSINNQFLFYVVNGQGRLDDGKMSWELRNGITMLIPPNVQRRFVNTSSEPLEMVMVEWPANALARKDILVRDVTLLPYCEENAHWNNMSKCVFTQADGMTGRVLLVMLVPMTMAAPHTHGPGTEEIWTKLTPGTSLTLLGSELREMPQFSAFLAPPDGRTWHGQVNTSKTQVEMWLYVAGGNAGRGQGAAGPGAAQAPAPAQPVAPVAAAGGGRGGGNPNLSRDQAVVDQANVRGTPLK
jgi:mannose-6-phosphate isomerase-like protein (cupin superfamily)